LPTFLANVCEQVGSGDVDCGIVCCGGGSVRKGTANDAVVYVCSALERGEGGFEGEGVGV
jgi:ribose 5-phosphate isomerase RpiB